MINIRMDSVDVILSRRRLQQGGPAQILFTKECSKAMNNFIPLKTGRLKDMSVEMGTNFVTYNTPYARKQFYTNAGNGIGGTNKGGIRGSRWDKKMWIISGDNIVKKLANYVGGRSG